MESSDWVTLGAALLTAFTVAVAALLNYLSTDRARREVVGKIEKTDERNERLHDEHRRALDYQFSV